MTLTMDRPQTTTTPTPALPRASMPAPHLLGPLVSGGQYVWHISVTHAGQRYQVRVAYDPRPGADAGTTDVAISPSASLDVGTAVLHRAHDAAVWAAADSTGRWRRLYGGLADALAFYSAVRDMGIQQWG